jgi:fucose permease
MNKLQEQSKTFPFYILYCLIFIAGMSFSVTGAIIPEIAKTFNLTSGEVSTLPQAQFFGGFLGLVVLGFLLSHASPRILLAFSMLIMAIGALIIVFITRYSGLVLFIFFCIGMSMSIIFGLTGVIVSRASGANSARNLNIHYSFMSAGVVLSPVLYGMLVSAGFSYRAMFMIISGLAFAAGTAAGIIPLPPVQLGEGYSVSTIKVFFREHILFLLVILIMSLCYMGSESIPNNWIPKFLNDTFEGFPEFRSRLILSLFWASVTVGRYICAAVLNYWKNPRGLLAILSLLAASCLIMAPNMSGRTSTEIVLAASGLFFSGIIPIIFSFTEQLPERLSGIVFILVLTVGMLGASLASRGVGLVADRFGFRPAIMLGAVPLIIIVVLSSSGGGLFGRAQAG